MIKILNLTDRQQFLDMMYEIDTVMGQPMDTVGSLTGRSRRQILSDYLIDSWLQYPDSVTRRNIGWFHNDELKAVLFQDFSKTVKAWSISYYFSSCGNLLGRQAGGECLDFALTEAERLNYYEYYRVIEASKYKAFDRYAISKLRHRYELVLDETVPAHEKPMTSLSWNWLFEGSAKSIDTVIVKGLLKQEFRPNTI
jgi:hypothetical protein